MNIEQFKQCLENKVKNGTLLTAKPDPANLSTTHSKYRSVLSFDAANDLEVFIVSGDFTVSEYNNPKHFGNPYFLITPNPTSTFSVPASGVSPHSSVPNTALDSLVAVSGYKQGWHVFGESNANVQQKMAQGSLVFLRNL